MTRMMLRTQIILLPVVAAVAFILLIVINLGLGRQSAHLANIEQGYLPAFATTREAENLLNEVNRVLQDASMAQEEDRLADADAQFKLLLKKIDLLIANPTQDQNSLYSIRRNIDRYYKFARATTLSIIRNQVGEQLQQDVVSMMDQYKKVCNQLSANTMRGQEAMQQAFRKAYEANTLSTYINVFVAIIALIGLAAIAFFVVRGVVGALSEAINHLSTASIKILSLTEQTENNATIEATAVHDTQQTMIGLVSAADKISASAGEVQMQSEKSNEASRLINERVASLNEQALKIAEISKAIHDIASKSNLLAFNASIEGAKAGDAGQGFLIVAAEIRHVAEMVIGAARQIKNLSSGIDRHSKEAISTAEDGSRLAEANTELSKRISFITTQQQSDTEQVSRRMQNIQQFTSQTLADVKQLKSTTDDLVNTATSLTGLLSGQRSESSQ